MTTTKTETADEDIVIRLRAWADSFFPPTIEDVLIAADEIEKLREELNNPVCDCPYLDDVIKKDDKIERLREENAQLRELLQKWLGNCFVDVYGNGVTFGMGVRKVWAETRDALKEYE